MSYLKVPEPVRELFDAFPRHKYPAIRQHTALEKQAFEERRFSYSASSLQDGTHFTLVVYNVFQTPEQTYLATDPLCLSAELALALRNNNSLPKVNHDHADKSRNAVFIASHHAHPEGHLPLYVEEDALRKSRRITKDSVSVQETLVSRVDSSSELMLITLVDSVVYDAWMTAVLFDIDDSVKSEIYQYQQSSEFNLVNRAGLSGLLSQLVTRNNFALRNRQIVRAFDSTVSSVLVHAVLRRNDRGVEFEKQRNYREFSHALQSIDAILSRKGTQFFSANEKPGLLDIKLASYVTLIQKFMLGTSLHETLDEYPGLKTHAVTVVKACS
ncbi:Sorting assembly machinery 35 kDa subunit [Cyberlindnera fabianii]|uniref:Sorting assembly machinery 35 kDa subunit n=1 Tax=Cyberlindnera fabianii TaxID=36022 RepID=A0A1V2L5B6_CYBFA|nr:Sorting assembly machinery 35 kDa subunit [Cyberlindnera fabianii]